MKLEHIIERGRTYGFEHLPKLLWVSTGERLPDIDSYQRLQKVRNTIQHFCAPPKEDLRGIALEFLYKNIDPLIHKHFDLFAIEYHEDLGIGYDYVVSSLIAHELYFSIPKTFEITEINLEKELSKVSAQYRKKLLRKLSANGFRP